MAGYAASIDDNDARVQYLGSWTLRLQDGPWTGTYHETRSPGSQAFVEFTGSRVAILVNIPSGVGEDVMVDVRLNNGDIIPVRYKTISQSLYGMVLWDSGPIAFGTHTLEVSNAGLSRYLRLDRFAYDPTDFYDPGRQSSSATSKPLTTSASQSLQGITTTAVAASPGQTISVSNTARVSGQPTNANVTTVITPGQTVTTSPANLGPDVDGGSTLLTTSTSTQRPGGGSAPDAQQATSRANSISTREVALIGVLAALIPLALIFWFSHRQFKLKRKREKRDALWDSLRDSEAVPYSASLQANPFPVQYSVEPSVGLERPRYSTEKRVLPSTSPSLVLLQPLRQSQGYEQSLASGSSDINSPAPSNSSPA